MSSKLAKRFIMAGFFAMSSQMAFAANKCGNVLSPPSRMSYQFLKNNVDKYFAIASDNKIRAHSVEWTEGVEKQFASLTRSLGLHPVETLNSLGRLAVILKNEKVMDFEELEKMDNKSFANLMFTAQRIKFMTRTTPELVGFAKKILKFQQQNSRTLHISKRSVKGLYSETPIAIREIGVVKFPSIVTSLEAIATKRVVLEDRELKETREITISTQMTDEGRRQVTAPGTLDLSRLGQP